jgi:hypothetical protein
MTSPAMTALHSVGITHSIMILGVLFVVAAVVIGMYWHVILPGAIMLGVAFLFLSPDGTDVSKIQDIPIKVESITKKDDVFDERQAYMKDCMEIAEYPMAKCAAMWSGRETDDKKVEVSSVKEVSTSEHEFRPVSDIKLLDVDNQEYKSKRASAVSKPNAVVLQATYR